MEGSAEIAVVGAGVVGLCTAYALRERGVAVRVVEPGAPGNGQSGGPSRIFRHAHDDPRLVSAARASRALWRDWGERLGIEIVSGDGAVAIGDAVPGRLAILHEDGGVPARAIDAGELAARLPPLARYEGPAMIDEAGGAIRTEEAVAALAAALGDAIATDEVLAVRPADDGTVELITGGERRRYAGVLVCAGRGTAALARPLGLAPPVTQAAHIRLTFRVRGGPPERLACLQDSSGAFGESGAYAAALPGNREYAVGLAGTVPAADRGVRDPGGLAALAARTQAYAERALPGLDPRPVGSRACWVTELEWGPDGVAVWEAGAARFLLGHNLFKQAPGLGRALADLATGATPALDLRPEARLGRASAP